jgi:predicted Fe-Mo cluster-binding NifX family protein
MNYQIVVFKNKRKKKIINKFTTSKKANEFYKKLLEENELVDFEVKTENGKSCDYEVALLERKRDDQYEIFARDEFGRNIKIDLDNSDYGIIKISPYKVPETIKDYQTGNKINFKTLLYRYLPKDGIKMVSKLNNKIIIQQDDSVNLFVLKTDGDALRLLESLTNHFLKNKRGDCMFVPDTDIAQKKYLYDFLESKGYSKKFLYRKETTYSSDLRI